LLQLVLLFNEREQKRRNVSLLGKNAISQLVMFLSQFNIGQNDVYDFIKFLARHVCQDSTGKLLNIDFSDFSGELTLNLATISVDEDMASAVVNIRYPVSYRFEDIIEKILQISGDKKIEVSVLNHRKPLHVEKDSNIVSALMAVYKQVTGKEPYTLSIGGQTYAKAFKNMVAFGPVFDMDEKSGHMANEYINIDDLIRCAIIYGKAMYELAK
jgi:succinyl-diaminopimelate desuccinylase